MNSTGTAKPLLTLHLRMLGDWRVGSGTAAHGYIDRQVQRDVHGLPFVPAKTLIGVWRDACEVAASALDSGPAGVWHGWVDHLFGGQPAHPAGEDDRPPDPDTPHPRPATLALRGPLCFPGRLGPVLAARPRLREAVTFVKPGVAIDPRTGAADENMLRYEEMARGGVTLVGTAELAGIELLDADQQTCAFGLLWAGARLVEGIGGKRRRGAGRCRLEPTGPGLPPRMDRLEELAHTPVAPPPAPLEPGAESAVRSEPGPVSIREPALRTVGTGWERTVLTLTLDTPLLAHDRTVGNMVLGRDHVPGWLLMPAVLSRLGSEAAAAARRGDLVVTAGTPVIDGLPGRPVPRVLAQVKDEPGRIVNRMAETDETASETTGPVGGGLKRFRSGYITADPDRAIKVHQPEFVTRMHNTVNDTLQRPTEDLGGVYVYRALASDTVLAAEVRARSGLLQPDWHEQLTGTWRLGGSSKDDYGLVTVTARPGPAGPARPAAVPSLRTGDPLSVWLLSDTLVRDPRLAPSSDPADLCRALERAFTEAGADGVRLEPVGADGIGMPNAYETSRTDSWHRGWRLPRPSLLGFAAGGCLTFHLAGGRIGPDALAAVELAGVGERRGEGFGQVRFDDPLLTRPVPHTPKAEKTGDAPEVTAVPGGLLTPEDPGYAEARVIERASWRAEIWRSSEKLAANPGNQVLGPLIGLSTNQLNTIRGLLNRLDEGVETLSRRIKRITARWEGPDGQTDSGAPTARRALEELLITEDRLWHLLDLPVAELCLTHDASQKLRGDLRAEALRSLLTACLSARARLDAQRPSEGDAAEDRDGQPDDDHEGGGRS